MLSIYLLNSNNSCIESGPRLWELRELAIREEVHRSRQPSWMKRKEKGIQMARVQACANTFELTGDVDGEQLADGSIKLSLEKKGAMSVGLQITMPRTARERRRTKLELLVEMAARAMESAPILSQRSRR